VTRVSAGDVTVSTGDVELTGLVGASTGAVATHLFEEPGALDEVAELAARWFARHLEGRGVPA
jgi:hypothetical protein